jgi:hypothetical protein
VLLFPAFCYSSEIIWLNAMHTYRIEDIMRNDFVLFKFSICTHFFLFRRCKSVSNFSTLSLIYMNYFIHSSIQGSNTWTPPFAFLGTSTGGKNKESCAGVGSNKKSDPFCLCSFLFFFSLGNFMYIYIYIKIVGNFSLLLIHSRFQHVRFLGVNIYLPTTCTWWQRWRPASPALEIHPLYLRLLL